MFRLAEATGTYGRTVVQYQLNYTIGGNTYARVFDEEGLVEFLRSHLGLTREAVDRTMEQLHDQGKVTVTEVEIPAHELPALGLEQLPSEY